MRYTHHISEKVITNFKNQLRKGINGISTEYMNKTTHNLLIAFAKGVKNRLLNRGMALANNAESEALIRSLAESIRYNVIWTGEGKDDYIDEYRLSIPIDSQGLILYLEYGTGLLGDITSIPSAVSKAGWHYAVNFKKWKKLYDGKYHGGEKGFFFLKSNKAFVSKDDVTPIVLTRKYKYTYAERRWRFTKPHQRTVNGKTINVRGYRSLIKNKRAGQTKTTIKQYTYDEWVWSRGIRSLHFFYDTRQVFRKVLRAMSGYNGRQNGFLKPIKIKGKIIQRGKLFSNNPTPFAQALLRELTEDHETSSLDNITVIYGR